MKEVVAMTHTVQNMDEETNCETTICSRLAPAKFEHLQPLSVYARMVTCDQGASLHQPKNFPKPFFNFKIEVVNSSSKKRKLDESICDEGYGTPSKHCFSPKTWSPDLGCVMDYYSPTSRQDLASPVDISLLDKTQPVMSDTKDTLNSLLDREHMQCLPSAESGGNTGTVPPTLKFKKVLMNLEPVFDSDVDDLLCLNPTGTYAAEGFSDNMKNCKISSSHTFQNKPDIIPTGSREPGDKSWKESKYLPLPTATSSPLHSVGEAQGQVRSVAEAPSQHTTRGKPGSPHLLEQNTEPAKPSTDKNNVSQLCDSSARTQRSIVFNGEMDWEHEKRRYVHLVNSHMNENPGATQDVMGELINLMTHVADQTPGCDGRRWQHPSDLTRRNYQHLFGNTVAKMTLDQWQAKNFISYRRFASVPKMFARSQFSLN